MNRTSFAVVGLLVIPCFMCFAMGNSFDKEECRKAEAKAVEFKRKGFERLGLKLDSGRLANYEETEIVDSFLQGRDFYRDMNNRRIPLSGKMTWLQNLFGEEFVKFNTQWQRKVADVKANRIPVWTRERIATRLDELAEMESEPMMMPSGMCRSSSGCVFIDVECIHCGRHTVYTQLDQVAHNQPPAYYRAVAKELGTWGLNVAVDGRAACPDCSSDGKDFKLSETPTRCRVKPDIDLSSNRHLWYVKPDWDLQIIQACARGDSRMGYDVRGVAPEAWLHVDRFGSRCLYDRPGGRIMFYASPTRDIEFSEPAEEMLVKNGGQTMKFVKVKNAVNYGIMHVKEDMVEVVERKRSSGLYDIPDTFFTFENSSFPVDEELADQMLAFVQGYTMTISGMFHDRSPIQKAIPRLREALVDLRMPEKR